MKITTEEYRYYEDSYMGYCTNCEDFTRDSTEPDAEYYDCPDCGENTVMGTMTAMFMGLLDIVE